LVIDVGERDEILALAVADRAALRAAADADAGDVQPVVRRLAVLAAHDVGKGKRGGRCDAGAFQELSTGDGGHGFRVGWASFVAGKSRAVQLSIRIRTNAADAPDRATANRGVDLAGPGR